MAGALRFALSFLAAAVVVGALTLLGIGAWFERPEVHQVTAFLVEPASPAERIAAGIDARPGTAPSGPTREGFVQLRFRVSPEGRARDIEVLSALPAGYFEAAAIEQIRQQRFAPPLPGEGERVTTRIVDFRYPAPTSD
jgi:TonB family protein